MKTEEKEPKDLETIEENGLQAEKKRAVISVPVTIQEKKILTRMALHDCGISLSEFMRTKAFMEIPKKSTNEDEVLSETELTDEEKELYEERVNELNAENKKLKDEIVKMKIMQSSPSSDKDTTTELTTKEVENVLSFETSPEFKSKLETLKKFREEKQGKLSDEDLKKFYTYDQYVKTIFLRGLKRSFNNGILGENTGLTLEDIRVMAEAEKIDYDDEV